MTFLPGDAVHVAGLGKGIVREVLNTRRFRVEVKGRVVVAALAQLEHVQRPRIAGKASAAPGSITIPRAVAVPVGIGNVAPRSLDLHGQTVSEAVEALTVFLNDALIEGCSEVRVIHGRSGGRIKAAVHARLGAMSGVRFRLDPANAGVTIVTF
jgi:dsDNA-specific endonuclease/ATPase MutS2